MQQVNLDDIERYLKKRAEDEKPFPPDWNIDLWIDSCFAELRAREEAKSAPGIC